MCLVRYLTEIKEELSVIIKKNINNIICTSNDKDSKVEYKIANVIGYLKNSDEDLRKKYLKDLSEDFKEKIILELIKS